MSIISDFAYSNSSSSVNSSDSPSEINQVATQKTITTNTRRSMAYRGYQTASKPLTTTLQGSIWCGMNTNPHTIGHFNRNIVIKVSNKDLDLHKITVLDGKIIQVQESILSEMSILKYLTYHGIHYGLNQFIVNYIDFFYDESNYYLVMENGGISLFDFVLKAHQCLSTGKIKQIAWRNTCRSIFKQMVTFIHILHNTMSVCHLDISLENILIREALVTDSNHLAPQYEIKFCDFGLAERFDAMSNPNFLCNKWVGKTGYKSPEIFEKKPNFNAKAADIWSLGVCLFALLIGNMPYHKPTSSDPSFEWIISGDVAELIEKWGKASCVENSCATDILSRIFTKEDGRISTKQLLTHPWMCC
eukprot:183244_1